MKKLIYAIILLFVFSMSAFSSSFAAMRDADMEVIHLTFKEYSIDDLLNLRKMINIELDYRGYAVPESELPSTPKEVTVPVGEYKVGTDIPSGDYTVTSTGWLTTVSVETSAGKSKGYYCLDEGEQIGKLSLKEGDVISVTINAVIFNTYAGLGF